jgi:hypothetical protein
MRRRETLREALDLTTSSLGLDLVGKRFHLTTTGHRFRVARAGGATVEVEEGRTRRLIPLALIREAQAANLLEEITKETGGDG